MTRPVPHPARRALTSVICSFVICHSGPLTRSQPQSSHLGFEIWGLGFSPRPLAGINGLRTPAPEQPTPVPPPVSVPLRGLTVFGLGCVRYGVCEAFLVSVPLRGLTVFGQRKEVTCGTGLGQVSVPLRGLTVFGLFD